MADILEQLIAGADFDLQLFAEGGAAGGDGGDGGAAVGDGPDDAGNGSDTPGAQKGAQEEDDEAAYQKFKTRYKDRLDRETQDVVKKRLRNVQPKATRADRMQPVWDNLAQNLGLDPGDFEAIAKAVASDESGLERRANERGVTIDVERDIEQVERDAKIDRERADRMERANRYAGWKSQEAEVAKLYPGFVLEDEAEKNPRFARMLEEGDSVLDAYESTHVSEIRSRASKIGADQATQKVLGKIQGNRKRASEGAARRGTAPAAFDPGRMTDDQLDEIARRAKRGERITDDMIRKGMF